MSVFHRSARTVGGFAVAGALLVGAHAAVPATATAGEPAHSSCAVVWGSLPESAPGMTSARLTNLRVGRHRCFDRLVIDLGPRATGLPGPQDEGYSVRYVDRFIEDPSGRAIALAGGARLEIVVQASAVTDDYVPTYRPADRTHAVSVAGFSTFRQVYFSGSFEGSTQIGLGVRARLPFRVFVLDGPGAGSRIVIDVAHRW